MGKTLEIGARAEECAARWLRANGFKVLHRNWRAGRYELDIVASKKGVIHFVEVKCRRRGGLTAPEEAATQAKMRALQQAAMAYLARYEPDAEIQFDLIAVEYVCYGTTPETTPGTVPRNTPETAPGNPAKNAAKNATKNATKYAAEDIFEVRYIPCAMAPRW